MVKWKNNEILIKLTEYLTDKDIVSLTGNQPVLKNPQVFDNIFFLVYLLWVFTSIRRENRPGINALPIQDSHTLVLLRPYSFNSHFAILPSEEFIQDDLLSAFPTSLVNPEFCPVCNGLKFNMGVANTTLKNSIKADGPFHKDTCKNDHKDIRAWLTASILSDANYGWFLGGHPLLIDIPTELIRPLLVTTRIQSLFEHMLMIYLASRWKIRGFSANTTVYEPFMSFELDGIMMWHDSSGDKSKYRLLVVENTSGFEEKSQETDYSHLKQKILTFQALEDIDIAHFAYAYGSLLRTNLSDDNEVGSSLNYVLKNSNGFFLFSIEDTFDQFPIIVKSDYIDWAYFRQTYEFFTESYDKAAASVFEKP